MKFVQIEERCQGRVHSSGFCRSSPCSRRATIVTPEGKRFCSIHDPAKVAEWRKKSNERLNLKIQEMRERMAKSLERERRAALYDELVAALRKFERVGYGASIDPFAFHDALKNAQDVLAKAGAP